MTAQLQILIKNLFILLLIGLSLVSGGQTDSTIQSITIRGFVKDDNGQPISNSIIVNKRQKSGSFGKSDGSFSIVCLHTDTISFTSLGYHTREISYSDSVFKPEFYLEIFLDFRVYEMSAVSIFAPRDLEQIQKDIEGLGYNESDYMLSGINAAASPITFLYQQFSKKEQSRREAARLFNEDKKRDLLKELFHHYVDYEIIDLSDEEFDSFITYMNVSDDFLINSSQYDFLIYVRDRFKDYKIQKRQYKTLDDSDYDYNKD